MAGSKANFDAAALRLVKAVLHAAANAKNEAQLRHEIEKALEQACTALAIAWTPFQLERSLKSDQKTKFVDVAHGAVVVEYEPPRSFAAQEGRQLAHARQQAEEYAILLAREEGRAVSDYVLVAWDGAHISFGRIAATSGDLTASWPSLAPFNHPAALRLLEALKSDGIPLVHPLLLAQIVGPDSAHGKKLIPLFFAAIKRAATSSKSGKTKLLYAEWKRLFGQVIGVQSDSLRNMLARQSTAHGAAYATDPAAYLFALNTYIAMLAKLVAVSALPDASTDIHDASVAIDIRIRALESGALFEQAGISNMLNGDFFSWYVDDSAWPKLAAPIERLVGRLSGINYDVSRKSADSTRDLFKGIYEAFVPRELRHALGEFYTPDWLAEHALNRLGWTPEDDLLDPTCGSGTFLLEALRRRLKNGGVRTARTLLQGLYGFDLNPLAVLSAKGSLAVFIAPYLDASSPIHIPVYLADAINSADLDIDGHINQIIQTEIGPKNFRLPQRIAASDDVFTLFQRIRTLIDAGRSPEEVLASVSAEFPAAVATDSDVRTMRGTIETLRDLHDRGWNGIWCPILADRFAAGAVPRVRFICGNPPWVKWSHLPPEYAAFIAPRCRALGVFSSDKWVGGIESDMSTVITFEVIEKYLAEHGKLGFFITGTVFANESSEGFRRFELRDRAIQCSVDLIEDFTAIAPFDGVTNRPTLLVLSRGASTRFPVPYRVWSAFNQSGERIRRFADAASFKRLARAIELLAKPVPGPKGDRPWLIGTAEQHEIFGRVFNAGNPAYRARKGVTTDRNGIYWVAAAGMPKGGLVSVSNAAAIGRTKGIATRKGRIEVEHLFPLLRGRGVSRFRALPDPDLRVIVPQRGMHGDPDLPLNAPHTYGFLQAFKAELESRSSLRRFQRGQPFYSLWSTGPYTFSRYKVLWREMGGGSFAAAYIGEHNDALLGTRRVVPDHKLYFIPVETQREAAYLAGILNAPTVAAAISAYASQLSLGASVADYLNLPRYDKSNRLHVEIEKLATLITRRAGQPSEEEMRRLDTLVCKLLGATRLIDDREI